MTIPMSLFFLFVAICYTVRSQSPGTQSVMVLLGDTKMEWLNLPETEGDSIVHCPLEIDPYPVGGGLVFGAVGSAAGWDANSDSGPSHLQVVACGGIAYPGQTVTDKCYGWNETWVEQPSLLWPTFRAGAAKFGSYEEGEFLWVSGGTAQDMSSLATSQVYDFTMMEWTEGPKLPMAMFGHCKVKLNSTHTLVTGGEQQGGARTFLYDWEQAQWSELPPMIGGERFQHGCALMTDGRVVVAGGYRGLNTPEATVLNTTEVFDPVSLTWSEAGFLPKGLDGMILVPVETGPWKGQVLQLGGHIPDSLDPDGHPIPTDAVLRFTEDGSWEEVYKLDKPRAHFITFLLPIHCD